MSEIILMKNGRIAHFKYSEYAIRGLVDNDKCDECRVLIRDGKHICEDLHCNKCHKVLGGGRVVPAYPCEDCYNEQYNSLKEDVRHLDS